MVGGIRLGLAMQLKASVGAAVVAAADHALTQRLYGGLSSHPRVMVMGPPLPPDGDTRRRLPIVSFLIRAPEVEGQSRFLHYNFVATLLNDLFGIQSACLVRADAFGANRIGIRVGGSAADFLQHEGYTHQARVWALLFVQLPLCRPVLNPNSSIRTKQITVPPLQGKVMHAHHHMSPASTMQRPSRSHRSR